jgi:hypothetical protein
MPGLLGEPMIYPSLGQRGLNSYGIFSLQDIFLKNRRGDVNRLRGNLIYLSNLARSHPRDGASTKSNCKADQFVETGNLRRKGNKH